jgi:Xaa-Pro dipeptidase
MSDNSRNSRDLEKYRRMEVSGVEPRVARLRAKMAEAGVDAVVLTHPHDVRYATGYHSILERWTQMEPFAGAIIFADAQKPSILAIPEANLGVVAALNREKENCTFDEIRTFDMLNFCEVSRYVDPDRKAGQLAKDALVIAGSIAGECEPDIVAAVAAALSDHGMRGKLIGFDEHRVSAAVAAKVPHTFRDCLDLMMLVRVVKTDQEIEVYRNVGRMADRVIAYAGSLLAPGVDWNDVQAGICDFMVRNSVIPVDEGALLFGGSYGDDGFIPDLFRTPGNRPLREGDIVILETQGVLDGFWIDINRTAIVGQASDDYRKLHEILRDAFLMMVDRLRPGVSTSELPAIGYEHLLSKGVTSPEKLLVVAHGIGLMPLEIPLPFPASGLKGVKQGFRMEENMLVSLDSLFFGARLGPCHMENVYAITSGAPEPMYHTPLELIETGTAEAFRPEPAFT